MEGDPRAAQERAVHFIEDVYPRISNLGGPYRELKTIALQLAHDVLQLTDTPDTQPGP